LNKELMVQLYQDMVLCRAFDKRVSQLHAKGLIPGSVFPGVGEEATFVGATNAVSRHDYMVSTHRGYAQELVKGTPPKLLLAELLGKATGCCGGRAGQYARADAQTNNLGNHQVLGDTFTVAVGAALAQQRLNTGRIVLAFFGDGASNEGAFHESMNLSSLWRLPVVWVCDNNLYAMSTRFSRASAIENIADRACAYHLPGIVADGNDVEQVYELTKEARRRALEGEGPTLIECKTYRQEGHSGFDKRLYRPREEIDAWLKRDPIDRFEKVLRERALFDDGMIQVIAAEAQKCVDEAEEFALSSPEPSPDTGADLVFCNSKVKLT
jgi:pyruvate dehydrogenase E1 component alpha subunit